LQDYGFGETPQPVRDKLDSVRIVLRVSSAPAGDLGDVHVDSSGEGTLDVQVMGANLQPIEDLGGPPR
jgi:hypothetical protein